MRAVPLRTPRVVARAARHAGALGDPRVQLLLALAVYAAGAAVVTWPLVTDLRSAIYISPNRPFGDYTGAIANLRELVDHGQLPFLPGTLDDFNAPEGQPIQWGLALASPARTLYQHLLTMAVGGVAAWNLFVLSGFVATGTAMFLLVRRQTSSFALGIVFGWAFAFYPFAVVNGEHPDFIHGWPLVLMVWRWIVLLERPSRRNGLLYGAAAAVAMSWTGYYLLIAGVVYAALLAFCAVFAITRRDLRRWLAPILLAALPVAALAALLLGVTLFDRQATGLRPNFLIDVILNSARLPNFLLPTGQNPVLGGVSEEYLAVRGWHLNTEKTLYLGWSLLALAAVALASLLSAAARRRHGLIVGGIGFATFVAATFAGPPQIHVLGELVSTPSHLMFELTTAWRIFSRFVIAIELGVVILAALGAAAVLRGRSPAVRAAFVAALAVIVPLDLWAQFSPRVEKLETPGIYGVLRTQPPGIVAQFPLRPTEQGADYRDLFFQQSHGKPMLNGYPPRSAAEERAIGLNDLAHPDAAARLATLGVRYALVEHEPRPGFPATAKPRRGFSLIADSEFAALYRVSHARKAILLEPVSGFGGREGGPGTEFRWMTANPAELTVRGCAPCRGELRFIAVSFVRARTLRVLTESGRLLVRARIPPGRTRVRVPLDLSGTARLRFETDPGPLSVREALGAADDRSLSVSVGTIRFRTAAGERLPVGW